MCFTRLIAYSVPCTWVSAGDILFHSFLNTNHFFGKETEMLSAPYNVVGVAITYLAITYLLFSLVNCAARVFKGTFFQSFPFLVSNGL